MLNLDTLLLNLGESLEDIKRLVTAVSYVAGIFMVFKGVSALKSFGQHITQVSQRGEVAGPLIHIAVGGLLIYLPSTLDASIGTLFNVGQSQVPGSDTLLAYFNITSDESYRGIIDIIVRYMQLVGLVAFVRGMFILSRSSDPGQQPGSFTKGVTHIVGGVFAMNIVQTVEVLAQTLGFT